MILARLNQIKGPKPLGDLIWLSRSNIPKIFIIYLPLQEVETNEG